MTRIIYIYSFIPFSPLGCTGYFYMCNVMDMFYNPIKDTFMHLSINALICDNGSYYE